MHPLSYATEEMVVHEKGNQEIVEDKMGVGLRKVVSGRLAMQCKNIQKGMRLRREAFEQHSLCKSGVALVCGS